MKLYLALHGMHSLPTNVQAEVISGIRREIGPLVQQAGKTLVISVGNHPAELNLVFDTKSVGSPRKCGFVLLGEDGGGLISVVGHQSLRVCGEVNLHTGRRDTRRILTKNSLLGRALANTSIHELGHFIAGLDHSREISNYMITGDLPRHSRTLKSQRQFFAGHQTFSEFQKKQLVFQLAKGEWLGDFDMISK